MINKKLWAALIILTLVSLSIGAVSAADAESQANDDISIATSQDSSQMGGNELIQEDAKTDESTDILSSSDDEEILAGDMGISVVGGQKESYDVGEEVYLKLGTEQSSYTPADIYIQVQGGGYTDNPVGTYSQATSATGVPYTFDTPGNVSLRFVQVHYSTYYFSDYITFNVVEAGPSVAPGTFTDLKSLIDRSEGVLELPYDFTYDPEYDSGYVDGILVDKDITIKGNGHIINALKLAKIFDVYKANVVLEGVTLANGKSNNGGAIIVSNSITSLLLKDSVIKDSSSNQGGAIHVMGGTLTVENTTFTNNSANCGGAIYHNAHSSTLNVKDSSFEANKATSTGTAGGAGAIHMNSGKLNVENTDFNDNTAVSNGGAINVFNFANAINVTGSRFNRNSASDGGAIYAHLTSCDISINDSNFTENSANGQGGAAYLQGAGITSAFDNVKFADNSASYGGAFANKLSSSTIEKSIFEGNTASNQGGAIYASGKVTVNESSFAGNQASSDYNMHQIVENAISIENSNITVQAPDYNVKESYENGEDIVISGTFESGITNQPLALAYSLNGSDASASVDKNIFSIDLGNALKYGDYTISIKSFTDDAGNSYLFEPVEKAFTVKREVRTAADLQALIDNAEEGAIIELGNYSFENISNVKITKNVTIKGSEDTSISSAGDGNPIFIVPAKSENGPDSVNITGIDFKVKNGDVIVKATADNDTNPLSIDTQAISITGNTIEAADEDVVPESVIVLKLESERGVLAPTNDIVISGNAMDAGINPFDFDVTSVVSGGDVNIPAGPAKADRIETQIVYENMTSTAVDVDTDGRVGKYFYITLKDKNNNLLKNKPVQIGFNGNVYDRVTDENGQARLQINLKNAGTYTFAVSYLGDDEYNGSFIVAKIVVSKQKGSLTVPNKSYKASATSKTLTATFKSASGKLVKGKKVTFTVNGKTYSATTNAKGVATVKVSLSKKGTYSFTAKFAGNNMYAAMSKTAKLTIN